MKLYENTVYYLVKLVSPYSQHIEVFPMKINKHCGDCNTTPTQKICYDIMRKDGLLTSTLREQNAVLHFTEDLLKSQTNKIFKISYRQALCLTITDCEHFIRQYYKGNKWWIPKEYKSYESYIPIYHKEVRKKLYKQINDLKPFIQTL